MYPLKDILLSSVSLFEGLGFSGVVVDHDHTYVRRLLKTKVRLWIECLVCGRIPQWEKAPFVDITASFKDTTILVFRWLNTNENIIKVFLILSPTHWTWWREAFPLYCHTATLLMDRIYILPSNNLFNLLLFTPLGIYFSAPVFFPQFDLFFTNEFCINIAWIKLAKYASS